MLLVTLILEADDEGQGLMDTQKEGKLFLLLEHQSRFRLDLNGNRSSIEQYGDCARGPAWRNPAPQLLTFMTASTSLHDAVNENWTCSTRLSG